MFFKAEKIAASLIILPFNYIPFFGKCEDELQLAIKNKLIFIYNLLVIYISIKKFFTSYLLNCVLVHNI